MTLKVSYRGTESSIEEGTTALLGSDVAATIRIARPGISRRHAVISFDGAAWKLEDAGSRNGTYRDGQRIQAIELDEPTTVFLGHPTNGERLDLDPTNEQDEAEGTDVADVEEFVLPDTPPEPEPASDAAVASPPPRFDAVPAGTPVAQNASTSVAQNASRAELEELTLALRDQISAVKGLTWSVWAMIAVTAALAVMTLFVGILGS